MWVLTIEVLEVNPERDSIRAQRGRARSELFSRVFVNQVIASIMSEWEEQILRVMSLVTS